MLRLLLSLLLLAPAAQADTVIAARTIRAQTVIGVNDLVLRDVEVPGALSSLDGLVGMETRQALYAGRPIRPGDLGPPALIDRNQVVRLIYDRNGLMIVAEARALGRGGAGEVLRVMNMDSRQVVNGVIQSDGTVKVQ
ncbi:flagellar basal body P-ring formation chaperone FlgA [Pseudooceanicola sp. HF7]|uniref:flagellar basal body P-ring formation chaperone FlgA n=1 Tax=Pseudooceanicola sp. HF7 TaxID=2721560 RepID=UPI001431CD48|nr:flagellar basal body P-ring formation chaperone FlgA [Pseudooceanicola sp. HF7]NIZ09728.1 flagellar basal body P-ring formation protein FlgA [Pseudooceanicola sp. HF7]